MSAELLDELKAQVRRLTAAEREELAAFLAADAAAEPEVLRWQDLRGLGSGLLGDEDAQEWVTRTRREAQEQRDRALGIDLPDE